MSERYISSMSNMLSITLFIMASKYFPLRHSCYSHFSTDLIVLPELALMTCLHVGSVAGISGLLLSANRASSSESDGAEGYLRRAVATRRALVAAYSPFSSSRTAVVSRETNSSFSLALSGRNISQQDATMFFSLLLTAMPIFIYQHNFINRLPEQSFSAFLYVCHPSSRLRHVAVLRMTLQR